ncbi:tether containing UBX domain for GLUT4 isoform X1 [Gorilla gorilla gorilla]|uniref:tether containing UBX domain for GLUT4 isoform X1 n=2 Tax=Gorilla gorilla gorilla TaxID=9595 RepID=UPI00244626F3|nr:tether containing UBX domain for GLUT4 isoform X4 [Gorilla gorilla gorilla]
MAAPAGGGGSAVSVLAPNGRRHTVKVTPSTVLLQVLEDTCRRQDFNPCEYDLKFQRSVLDLSLQWRFANLPNNAKLEMVPASRSREGPENMVRIALQLDDGSRLQDSFCSGQTLWELLSHFAQTRECLQHPGGATPVCVYTRDEVTGEAALRGTTLQSLGLTGGSATIRFVMKRYDPVGKTPGSLGSSASAGQAAARAPLPLESGELSRGDLSRREDADTSGPCCEHTQEKQSTRAPAPAPFVPFSGGGQRLGGPPGPTRPLTSSSAKLPKSLSSPGGPSKPKKSKSGQDPQQEQQQERERDPQQEQEQEREPEQPLDREPVDREPVVCHPDLEERLQAWPAELPDEFFELTVDDVRRRLAQLKSERKRLEEAPLVTKAFREAQIKEKLERYPKVALRVLFPDRYVLQGFFRPSETVGDLRDFVRSHLGNPKLSFYLFITPPKTVLDDHTQTLFQANLFPAALVHFGAEEPAGVYLEPGLLEHAISPSAADVLVARYMSRAARSPSPLPAPDPAPKSEPAAEEGALVPPEPIPGTAQPVKRSLGKVPKWLKLPASKR